MTGGADGAPPGADWHGVDVRALVSLERIDARLFRSRVNQRNVNGALYGGQIVAQALAAAAATVAADRLAHSLHAYFLRAGDCGVPVVYEVETSRDGGRFSARHVRAIQNGDTILSADCSFRVAQPGWSHQTDPMAVPPPESLPAIGALIAQADRPLPAYIVNRFGRLGPIEVRPVAFEQLLDRQDAPRRQIWMRAPLAADVDDPAVHQQILTYMSDFWLSGAALVRHASPVPGLDHQIASLDHAIWFHRPIRADAWLLYETESPSMADGTGLSRGMLFDRGGALVASVAQEALFRKVKRPPDDDGGGG